MTNSVWTKDMDQTLLFMDFIGCSGSFMADVMENEYMVPMTKNSVIGRRWRISKKGNKYNYKDEDFT